MTRRVLGVGLLAVVVASAIALAVLGNPRRVGKLLLLGLVANQHEQIVYSFHAKRAACPASDAAGTVVLAVLGQSNAGNFVIGLPSEPSDDRVVVYYHGSCYAALNPLVGSSGIHGSIWPAVGKGIVDSGKWSRAVIAPMAVGGSALAHWIPGGVLHGMLQSRLGDLRAAGFRNVWLLWHQGESDMGGDSDAYLRNLNRLISATRTYFPNAPFFVSVAASCEGNRDERLARAQRAAVAPAERIFPGPDTDTLGDSYRADGCHFNARGGRAATDLWLKALARH